MESEQERVARELGNREQRLRRLAKRPGLWMRKSRAGLSLDNHGGYMLVDPHSNTIIAGQNFELSPDSVEAHLAEYATNRKRAQKVRSIRFGS